MEAQVSKTKYMKSTKKQDPG